MLVCSIAKVKDFKVALLMPNFPTLNLINTLQHMVCAVASMEYPKAKALGRGTPTQNHMCTISIEGHVCPSICHAHSFYVDLYIYFNYISYLSNISFN